MGVVEARTTKGTATGLSLMSWVLFAGSGPVAKAVMTAGWSPGAVTSARIAIAALVLVPTSRSPPRRSRGCRRAHR
ncbi:hypothetical protein [Labedaea rhizosphaerae]|uniref:EamA-like transporter family protein n=1 Tax=Labedaea rhizosphaerae TaxID=598644 RepID=A0A4R6S9Y9_LABRH|nr:hypothetical protein [Labedaea rhizosphaerae]TDP96720.1 hypothetical protein EV186_104708 [Labedaea rhizosphaerae]